MLPKSFFCCWNTTTGCVVIGYVTGALSITLCVGSVLRLMLGLPLILQNDDLQGQFPFNPLFFVFSAAYFGFHTVTSFGLVPGVQEGQAIFIIPSLVMISVDIVLSSIGLIVLGMMLDKQHEFQSYFVTGLVIGSILLPLLIYSSLIVISEFEEILKKFDKVPPQKSDFESNSAPSADSKETLKDTSYGTVV